MYKDWIIIVILVISICTGNVWMEKSTKTSVDGMEQRLNTLKETCLGVIEEKKSVQDIPQQLEDAKQYWETQYAKLAFFIEHNELEKVNTQLAQLEGNVLVEDYEQAIPNVENCSFVLYHIKEKNRFAFKNIF